MLPPIRPRPIIPSCMLMDPPRRPGQPPSMIRWIEKPHNNTRVPPDETSVMRDGHEHQLIR